VVGLLIALGLWIVPARASAQALPDATSQAEVTSNNPTNDITDPSSISLQGASASVTLPQAQLKAQIIDATDVATQNASSSLNYYFEVIGGTPGNTVPILINTHLSVSSSGYPTEATASIHTDGSGASAASMSLTVGDSPTSLLTGDFFGSLSLTSQSGQLRQLFMNADVEEAYLYGGTGLATVDPYISIDPSFLNASDYSIEVSPGVANTALPEPTSLGLLVVGLGSLTLRRNRIKGTSESPS